MAPTTSLGRGGEPAPEPAPERQSLRPKLTEQTALPQLGSSLAELIDQGIYGMGPAGRRARSVQRAESLPPQRAWDQGTKASLEQAARAGARLRSKSLRPPKDDPWAVYFSERSDSAQPVWGQLSFRPRQQSGVVSLSTEAELTTGHIPVLRDESIDSLLGGPDGADGYYADGTFGRGRGDEIHSEP